MSDESQQSTQTFLVVGADMKERDKSRVKACMELLRHRNRPAWERTAILATLPEPLTKHVPKVKAYHLHPGDYVIIAGRPAVIIDKAVHHY